MKQLFIVLFLLFSCLTYSQVTIEGTIPDYAEQPVRIIQYEDYFTNKEILIKTVNTNKDGIFKVQFPLKEIQKITIKTNHTKAILYAEPAVSYNVEMGKKDTNATETIGTESAVGMVILNQNDQSLNNRIIYFEQMLSQLLCQ
jgi:hypothetical protein